MGCNPVCLVYLLNGNVTDCHIVKIGMLLQEKKKLTHIVYQVCIRLSKQQLALNYVDTITKVIHEGVLF